jgi:predicted transport protein
MAKKKVQTNLTKIEIQKKIALLQLEVKTNPGKDSNEIVKLRKELAILQSSK